MRTVTLLLTTIIVLLFAGCGGEGKGTPIIDRPPLGEPEPTGPIAYADLPPGSFALSVRNLMQGVPPGLPIFVTIVGFQSPGGQPIYVRPGARLVSDTPAALSPGPLAVVRQASAADNVANCDADGICYVDYAFTLADMGPNGTIYLPGNGNYYGARIYISLGRALLQRVDTNPPGVSQPSLDSASDPNVTTVFDWFEFEYDTARRPTLLPFSGNTTQVDQFGIPLKFSVTDSLGITTERGIEVGPNALVRSREDLIRQFANSTLAHPASKTDLNGPVDFDKVVRLSWRGGTPATRARW